MSRPLNRSLPLTTLPLTAISLMIAACAGQAPGPEQGESVLGVFAPPTPAEAAAWAADPYDSDKRQRGVLLLANAPFGGEGPYLRLYEVRLTDEDPVVRAAALKALALHGTRDHATPIARRLLEDESESVRAEAARALQRIHEPRVVDALITAVDPGRESDPDVRARAARALGQYASPEVVQTLIGALNDRRLTVNANALESLRILTGKDFGYDARAWLEWTNQTPSLFAGRRTYEYPVFERDPRVWELLLPFWSPPNEIAATPAGMPADQRGAGAPEEQGDKPPAGG